MVGTKEFELDITKIYHISIYIVKWISEIVSKLLNKQIILYFLWTMYCNDLAIWKMQWNIKCWEWNASQFYWMSLKCTFEFSALWFWVNLKRIFINIFYFLLKTIHASRRVYISMYVWIMTNTEICILIEYETQIRIP